ncbi:E3 ubiquitin-protein ligase MARCHF5-like [Anopheles aquasalis]|uniref:E3 ubiquitin-protein ligase MARCHF5-like n=1 Tax=Anopheles aquasalis TaxID=42839 RepID=UPI00215ACCB3|nr:E3 ubiquitin-protein ligase MARCHF5-like [Anopheles aquasalis]XP_050099120.1 E3 ubiquitin-protein ligase MARCHF5-like [Anopheles aquasalis]
MESNDEMSDSSESATSAISVGSSEQERQRRWVSTLAQHLILEVPDSVEEAAAAALPAPAPAPAPAEPDERYCWVCFATEEDDRTAAWVQPCNCRGATKWVHQSCLLRWIDEKQRGNPARQINCPQCRAEYFVILPSMGSIAMLLERLDQLANLLSPGLAAGVIICSVYWSALTFGAITLLQTIGYEQGMTVMRNAESYTLMLCLPTIPVALIIGQMIRWESVVLRFIQKRQDCLRQYPVISLVLPVRNEPNPPYPNPGPLLASPIHSSDPLSVTRLFCGALMLPTVASMIGRVCFSSVENHLRRTVIGGLVFVAVKGVLKIYYHLQKYSRASKRFVLDFTPASSRRDKPHTVPPQQQQDPEAELMQNVDESGEPDGTEPQPQQRPPRGPTHGDS